MNNNDIIQRYHGNHCAAKNTQCATQTDKLKAMEIPLVHQQQTGIPAKFQEWNFPESWAKNPDIQLLGQ